MKSKIWKNWAGNVQCRPLEIKKPGSEEELVEIVRSSAKKNYNISAVGSGHSYNRVACTGGTLISLDKLQGIENVDIEKNEATVLAGTKLKSLGKLLWDEGLAMENLGDTHAQSLAGAASTSTHGSGITLGSVSTQIVGLTIVTATGDILECSPKHEPEIFKAAQVSLGSLGVVTKIRLKLAPAYKLKMVKENLELEEALANIDESIQKHRHYEFWYWPDTTRVSVRISDYTDEKITENAIKRFLDKIVMQNWVFWLLNTLVKGFPSLSEEMSGLFAKLGSEGKKVDRSYRILTSPRMVRLTEMEYAVPAEAGPDCLREIQKFHEKSDIPVSFPIQYRYVAADDIYLSPYYMRDSALIDVQQFKGMPNEEYFLEAETIFKKYEGRPHWGKIHYRSAHELKEMYPMWDKFHEIRKRLDPDGVFMNTYLKRVFGE